jgi:CRISPR-associated protein Cas2
MVVYALTNAPAKVRGDLSLWCQEIVPGIYVGEVSSRVRDELWNRICENIGKGRAVMVYSTDTEQGYDFRLRNATWMLYDMEGVHLLLHPSDNSNLANEKPASKSFASIKNMAKAARKKKQLKGVPDRYVVLDIETTGLNPQVSDIEEIGAIKIDGNERKDFHCFIKTEKSIPADIQKINHITKEELMKEGVDPKDAFLKLKAFIMDDVIVGHNITNYDLPFVNAKCGQLGIEPFRNKTIDTLHLARLRIEDIDNYTLRSLAEYYKIDVEESHRAMADCETTLQLFLKLNENS